MQCACSNVGSRVCFPLSTPSYRDRFQHAIHELWSSVLYARLNARLPCNITHVEHALSWTFFRWIETSAKDGGQHVELAFTAMANGCVTNHVQKRLNESANTHNKILLTGRFEAAEQASRLAGLWNMCSIL